MRKPAKAAPRRTWPLRRVRGSIPASPPNESALGYLANENASHSSLLFPVIVITGISDVNDIKHLAISARSCDTQTLHLVFWGAKNVQLRLSRDQSEPAGIKSGRPGHGGFSGFFGHLALAEGAIPCSRPVHVQIAISPVHLAIFTRSILLSKHYTFDE